MLRVRWVGAVLVALSALALAVDVAEAGGACRGVPVSQATNATVHMEGNCFVPTVLHVGIGETVSWGNLDPVAHTVSGANLAWGDYTEIQQGRLVSHQFVVAGVYSYYCFLHPGMIGTIVVGNGAAASASATDDAGLAVPATGSSGGGHAAFIAGVGSGAGAALVAAIGALVYATRRRTPGSPSDRVRPARR